MTFHYPLGQRPATDTIILFPIIVDAALAARTSGDKSGARELAENAYTYYCSLPFIPLPPRKGEGSLWLEISIFYILYIDAASGAENLHLFKSPGCFNLQELFLKGIVTFWEQAGPKLK